MCPAVIPADQQGNRPFIGHKFRALDANCWRSLATSKFYFAKPLQLNDPWDCQIDLRSAFSIARRDAGANAQEVETQWDRFSLIAKTIEEKANGSGVFCLCCGSLCDGDANLLWAHYAANHSGICLTFEIPNAFVVKRVGQISVSYNSDALLSALRALDLSPGGLAVLTDKDFDEKLSPVIQAYLSTKAKQWRYEDEARIIDFRPGLVEFDRGWLKQICFGLRTSEVDRGDLASIAKDYPNCQLAEVYRAGDELHELRAREVRS